MRKVWVWLISGLRIIWPGRDLDSIFTSADMVLAIVASLLAFAMFLFFAILFTRTLRDFLTGLIIGMGTDVGPACVVLDLSFSARATMSSNELLRRRRE